MPINFKEKLEEAVRLYDLAGVHPAANLMPMMSDEEYLALVEDVRKNGFLHPARVTSAGLLIDGRNRLCASIDVENDVRIEEFNPVDPIAYVLSENLNRRHLNQSQRAFLAIEVEKMYAAMAKDRQATSGPGMYGSKPLPEDFPEAVIKPKEPWVIPQPKNQEQEPNPGSDDWLKSIAKKKPEPEPYPSKTNWLEDLTKKRHENESREQAAKTVGVSGKMVGMAKAIEKADPEIAEEVKAGAKTINAAMQEIKEKEITRSTSKFNVTNGNIEWAKYSWNPVTGCKYGCEYCYAYDIGMRFDGTFEPTFHPERLCAAANTPVPPGVLDNNVFVCSMADLFGPWVPDEWIESVLTVVGENPQWNFLFLTKNPARYADFEFPKNCLLGATADTQARADSAGVAFEKIKDIDNILFLSCEPMLEPITLKSDFRVDWVIVGGRSRNSRGLESQPEWEWVENLLKDSRKLGASVYFKPNLTVRPKEKP